MDGLKVIKNALKERSPQKDSCLPLLLRDNLFLKQNVPAEE